MQSIIHGLLVVNAVLAVLVAIARAHQASRRGMDGEEMVSTLLTRAGSPPINGLYLRGADGRLTQIDHLALGAGCILVIETKTLSGEIRGGAEDPHWTQRVGRFARTLQNPLRQNHRHIAVLRGLHPGARFLPLVVCPGTASFPAGSPGGVATLDELRLLAADARPLDPATATAWGALRREGRVQAGRRWRLRREHLRALRRRHGGRSSLGEAIAGPLMTAAATALLAAVI